MPRLTSILFTVFTPFAIATPTSTSAESTPDPPITLRTGDQATGTLANFNPISATPTPGDYGSFDLFFTRAPLDGDILEIQFFARAPHRSSPSPMHHPFQNTTTAP